MLGKEQVTNSNSISCVQAAFPSRISSGFTFTSSSPLAPACCARMCPGASLPRLVISDFSSDKTVWQLLVGSVMPVRVQLSALNTSAAAAALSLLLGTYSDFYNSLPTLVKIQFPPPYTVLFPGFLIPVRISCSKIQKNSLNAHLNDLLWPKPHFH